MGKFLDTTRIRRICCASVRDVLSPGHFVLFCAGRGGETELGRLPRRVRNRRRARLRARRCWFSVWLYAYALGVTSSRRLEQRHSRGFAFRYLAGGAAPDHWTLNDFRRRHARGLNDLFTRVVGVGAGQRTGPLGHVAIDSTRIAANASRNRIDTESALRNAAGAHSRDIRRWQKQCDAEDPNERCGQRSGPRSNRAAGAATGRNSRTPGTAAESGPEKNSRAAIRTAVFCASGAGSRWATRPRGGQ